MLTGMAREAFEVVRRVVEAHHADLQVGELGTILEVSPAIARVNGLAGVGSEEVVRLAGDVPGMAAGLEPGAVGVVLLGSGAGLRAGDEVRRTEAVLDVPVGEALLGRVVDPLGRPLDDRGPIPARARRPIEREAPGILERAPVTVPLQTGLKVIDALLPIGRGQRELILGDRQTGKTSIAVAAIANQEGSGVLSVYCAIGQRGTSVARVVAELGARGALARSIVVVAGGEDPPGLQFVAPYAATAMAEHFVEQGRDVLIVHDDLTRHARAYRELSLLLRRPPGREAYPGDIFHVHARLLERAACLTPGAGGGTLTALPIAETQAQNLSAYIPTNLISITDGQVYLSPDLFQKGILPAVDVGRSVSRVGGKAQLPAYRAVAAPLRLAHAQFEELEAFARFGTRLDEATRRRIERGRWVREVLKQPPYERLPVPEQIAALLAATEGLFDGLPPERAVRVQQAVQRAVREELDDLCEAIEAGRRLGDDDRERLVHVMREALRG